MNIHRGFSQDAIHWKIDPKIRSTCLWDDPEVIRLAISLRPARVLDRGSLLRELVQRLSRPDDWPGLHHDFEKFHQLENAFLPYNRNGVLFPRKINGKYAMLSRPATTATRPLAIFFTAKART